jgi:hypothetical protein
MKAIACHKHLFFLLMLLSLFLHSSYMYGQEGFPYCEPLSDGQVPEKTIFGGHARLVPDANGNGVLQLTSNLREQSGYLYIDIPFPSSYGIKASFEYFSYGGDGNADGMVCFLFDAGVSSFHPGGFGGALGYVFNTAHQAPGLSGAYIGIGLDEHGNFTNPIEGKDGPGFRPNNITIRGPGDGFNGYQYISGIRTDQVIEGLEEEDQFSISSGGMNTSRVTDINKEGYRQVFIDLRAAPDGIGMILNLDMLVTTTDNEPRMVSIFKDLPYKYEAPENLKIGFAAATGGYTNFHEIRNLVVEVSDDENLQVPELKPKAEMVCEGDTLRFGITTDDVLLPNENSAISCIQLYQTLDEIVDEDEQDPCSVERCNPLHQRLALEEGIFVADPTGGGVSFTPAENFRAGEVAVFYTVTDNYGKTSKPEQLVVEVFDYPDAPVITERGGTLQADAFRLCEGEEVVLEAVSATSGSYRWYKDGEELEGAVSQVLRVNAGGVYTAWLFNEANCATSSREVEISYPPLPEVVIEELIVSCGERFADLRLFIESYNDVLYDYEVTAPDGNVLPGDGDLALLQESGTYLIRAKHKDLDCWSDVVVTELLMVDEPVEADFRYASVMEDGSEEVIDIFVNDLLQFTDLSLQQPTTWEWDFGDGNQSTLQHPRHTYTHEGNFIVTLTVYDEMGYCFSTKNLEVNVTSSYRIMYPNAFTPLGPDNRFFKPKTKGIRSMALYIFNSWGDLIYMSDDIYDLGWDGTSGGKLQPAGNYAFKTEFTSVLGERGTDSGRVTLIR